MSVSFPAISNSVPALEVLNWLASSDNAPSHGGLIVAAHPDDEVIGLGSRLPRLGRSCFVHVTDGAPRNLEDARAHGFTNCADYSTSRQQEFLETLKIAGIEKAHRESFDYPDQEASFHLAELTTRLYELILRNEPDFILTHPYEGGHPDHDATSFAVQCACALLTRDGEEVPAILEFSSYHNSPHGIRVGTFLENTTAEQLIFLSGQERVLKRRMFKCFATQQRVLSFFPIGTESVRIAPVPDFHSAPHPGTLFYEQFSWGLNGEHWRSLAADAMQLLELGKERS